MTAGRVRAVVAAVIETFGSADTFRCEYCGLSHETERPNCPACGGPLTTE
jgi:rubrerythrin